MQMVLIGAGQRGRIYADYIYSAGYAGIAAIVEPDDIRRKNAAKYLDVPESRCFKTVEELWALGKIADAAIIASMDLDHYNQVMRALDLGYDILLEKPISPRPDECISIYAKAEKCGRKVVVCHVLRYTPFFSAIKNIIDSGSLGRVLSVRLDENVGNFHIAHSFVRGNWRRADLSSPIIMQKSCHDMDILNWLVGGHAKRIASFGSLQYFRPENAPANSAKRCCDCPAEKDCRFSAYKSYLPALGRWPATTVSATQTEQALNESLKTSPYGRCVYRCDNDVCDTQVASIEYDQGQTVSFTMSGMTTRMCRTIKVMCEHGEIDGDDGLRRIEVTPFTSNQTDSYSGEVIYTAAAEGGHGGGDISIVNDFIKALKGDGTESRSSIGRSVDSHIMAAAAEESRTSGVIVDLDEYRARLGFQP